ncbi:MAG: DMT family transporter [Pseudolabrys sp.]
MRRPLVTCAGVLPWTRPVERRSARPDCYSAFSAAPARRSAGRPASSPPSTASPSASRRPISPSTASSGRGCGFILVPLGHGTTIQPACAALGGLILATLMLHEKATRARVAGGIILIAGLMVFGWESLLTIGQEGVGGDLLFVTAGFSWALFGTLLRLYRMSGTRAIAVVGVLSVVVYAPAYAIFVGFHNMMQMSLTENLIQVVVQGLLAGMLPIYLFARAVILIGAGRAATFPALVPGFGLIIGYLALGVVPSVLQLVGLAIDALASQGRWR